MSAPSLNAAQSQLLQIARATQQPDTRAQAEASLQQYATSYPGFASLLVSLLQPALSSAVGADSQLLLSINLKLYVKQHWSEGVACFQPPIVPEEEKKQLYSQLLPLLATENIRVRRQVALVIAEVAEADFPERWSTLLPDFLTILQQAVNHTGSETITQANLLNGAMQAFVDFCQTMTDEQLVSTLPQLFPALLALCQKKFDLIMQVQRAVPMPQLDAEQKRAVVDAIQFCIYSLQIYQSCCSSLLNMNELVNSEGGRGKAKKSAANFNKVLNEFLLPSLPNWFAFMSSILTMPTANSSVFEFAMAFPTSWGLRLEAVKAVNNIGDSFEENLLSRGVEGAKLYENVMALLLDTMANLYPMYERRVLHVESGDDLEEDEETFDEDGNATTMTMFLYEAFTYFRTVLRIPPPRKTPAKKAAKKGAAPVVDQKQLAYAHLKSLFAHTPNSFLPRLLTLILQYGQLSTSEISTSLGHVEEFLQFQEDDDMAGEKVNVRTAVKDLLLGCILYNDAEDEEYGDDMAELQMMGFGVGGGMEGAGSELLDRTLVLHTLCPLLTNLLQHSAAMRAQPTPAPHWWKGRELTTLVLAHIVHDLTELAAAASQPPKKGAKKSTAGVSGPPAFDLQSFVKDILLPDLAVSGSTPTLLRTQSLASCAKFAPVFLRAKESNLVALALEALVANMAPQENVEESMHVRIAAVNAFGSLCSTIDQKLLLHNNILSMALTNICRLVHSAATPDQDGTLAVEESALVKTLQTLLMAIKVDEATTISAEPTITPLLLGAWSANASAQYIAEGVTLIFDRLLAFTPATCVSVQTAILPVIASIFQQNQAQVAITGTTAAALDLLKSVLLAVEKHTRTMQAARGVAATGGSSAAPELLHPSLFTTLLPHVLTLVLHTDDHDSIESGTTTLTAFLRIDAGQVATCPVSTVLPGAPAGSAPSSLTGLQVLCTIVNQFLNPALDDRVAHNVGNLIVQVVFSLSTALGESSIKELIKAVVARLYSSHYPPLNESLLLIFARLIHSSGVESIVGFLRSLGTTIPVQEKKLVPMHAKSDDKYATSFKSEMYPATVEPLPYLLKKWAEAQSDVHARYPNKVLNLALAKVVTYLFTSAAGVDALRVIECQGYVILEPKPRGKPVTRSATAGGSSQHEPKYTKIPLTTKLIKLFVKEWKEWYDKDQAEMKNAIRRAKKLAAREAGEDDDDEDDYDEDDDDEFDDDDDYDDDGDDDFIAKMQSKMGLSKASPFASASDFPDFGGPNSRQLLTTSDFLDYHADDMDEFDGETEEELYPESLTDPLTQIELGPFLQNFLKEFAAANGGAFIQETARYLDAADQKLLDMAIKAQPKAQTQ